MAGTLPDPSNATVAEYIGAWLRGAPKGSAKTMERYNELAANQVVPHLGAHKLQKLRPEHVQTWHGTLIGSGLSPRTVSHAHKLLHRVLVDAVKNGTLARNVAAVHAPPDVEDEEIEILPPEQIADVLAKLDGHTLFPIVSLALATGMRRGELWAAMGRHRLGRWHAPRGTQHRGNHGGAAAQTAKDEARSAQYQPAPETVAMLRAHKVQQMQLRLVLSMGKPEPNNARLQ